MDTPDPALAQARDAAQALVGAGVEVRHRLGGGRNSRIYHVRHGQREFALKQYPSRATIRATGLPRRCGRCA